LWYSPVELGEEVHYLITENAEPYIDIHGGGSDCFEPVECDISLDQIVATVVPTGCFDYNFTVSTTAGAGTYILQYDWVLGRWNYQLNHQPKYFPHL